MKEETVSVLECPECGYQIKCEEETLQEIKTRKMIPDIKEKIEQTIKEFNFAKVHYVMEHLGRWVFSPNPIPTIDVMKKRCRKQLIDVYRHPKFIYSSSGGFECSYNGDRFNIKFVCVESGL